MSDSQRTDPAPESTPRRTVLRSLFGAVVSVVTLSLLAACGGGDDGENEDGDDEDD